MRLEGRRESTNVEDRRGKKTVAAAGGIGLGGIIIYLIISLLGGDPNMSKTALITAKSMWNL